MERDIEFDPNISASVHYVRELLSRKIRCSTEFHELQTIITPIQDKYEEFIKECIAKSEICECLEVFQSMANVIKHYCR